MKSGLLVALGIAALMPLAGCGAEEEGAGGSFGAGMAGAVRLSQCMNVSVDEALLGHSSDETWGYGDGTHWLIPPNGVATADPKAHAVYMERLACMSAASNCEGVLGCTGLSQETCSSSFEPSCEGAVARTCVRINEWPSINGWSGGWGRVEAMDCSDDPHGNTECGLDTESSGAGAPWNNPYYDYYDYEDQEPDEPEVVGASCHGGGCEGTGTSCEGDFLVSCVEERKRQVNCAKYGMVCVESWNSATCTLPDQIGSCDDDYCAGSQLVACEGGRPGFAVDCSTYHPDFECVDSGEDGASCRVTTPKRVCDGYESECINETKLGICLGGVWLTGSCSSFQSGACWAAYDGVSCVAGQETGSSNEPDPSPETDTVSLDVQESCDPGDFTCVNGECISMTWLCDGMEDCSYGEDEYGCPAGEADSWPTEDATSYSDY